jgi:hypothetical protein
VRYQQLHECWSVRLESGQPLIETLTDFLRSESVELASLAASAAYGRR